MLKAGASVIIACRSKTRAEEAIAKLKELTKSGKITVCYFLMIFLSYSILFLMFLILTALRLVLIRLLRRRFILMF